MESQPLKGGKYTVSKINDMKSPDSCVKRPDQVVKSFFEVTIMVQTDFLVTVTPAEHPLFSPEILTLTNSGRFNVGSWKENIIVNLHSRVVCPTITFDVPERELKPMDGKKLIYVFGNSLTCGTRVAIADNQNICGNLRTTEQALFCQRWYCW